MRFGFDWPRGLEKIFEMIVGWITENRYWTPEDAILHAHLVSPTAQMS